MNKDRDRPGKDTKQNDQEQKEIRTDECHENKKRKILKKDKKNYDVNH